MHPKNSKQKAVEIAARIARTAWDGCCITSENLFHSFCFCRQYGKCFHSFFYNICNN